MGKVTERSTLGMFVERLQQQAAADVISAITTSPINSDQDSEDYAWIGQSPQMSEQAGEKKFSKLRQTPWTVKNVKYQGGISIPKNDVLYDKTGQVSMRVGELATRATSHWWNIIAPLIVNGESTNCYDNQYFFDTDHSEGDSGAQSNDITNNITTTTAPTVTEMIDAVLATVQQIVGFKDDRGEYCNEHLTEFLILANLSLLGPTLRALSQSNVGGGDTNVLMQQDKYRLRMHASPRFSTWTDRFAVFATQGDQKPIIRQQRKPNNEGSGYNAEGMLVQMLWTDSEHYKLKDECLISVETERAAAYGDWKKACLCTFT